jgi:hypothetical protein
LNAQAGSMSSPVRQRLAYGRGSPALNRSISRV